MVEPGEFFQIVTSWSFIDSVIEGRNISSFKKKSLVIFLGEIKFFGRRYQIVLYENKLAFIPGIRSDDIGLKVRSD